MRSINIRFPLVDDVEKNRLFQMNTTTQNALTSNLVLLLLTDKGERYYLSDYGTNLRRFLFEPGDNITQYDIEQDIKETVSKYIPQLTISGVQFFFDVDENGNSLQKNEVRLLVDFIYSESTFQENGRIELTL